MVLIKNKKLELILLVFSMIFISGGIYIISTSDKQPAEYQIIKIQNAEISAEIASSPRQQYIGLSGRKKLCSNCGMLFVFPFPEEQEFVMRNMNFPLDIIFIKDRIILNIENNLNPEGPAPTTIYRSAGPADMVLEVPGNFCDLNGIKIGNHLELIEKKYEL